MRMEINGRNYFMGNSCHIDIIYLSKKDRVEKGELRIMYCPTHLMLAGYFIKPLKVALFHKFRDIIIGRVSPYTILKDIVSYTSKEPVGKIFH